jgi:hypothetical protein
MPGWEKQIINQFYQPYRTTASGNLYQVFDGEPITLDEDGEPNLANPVFESDCFYTD